MSEQPETDVERYIHLSSAYRYDGDRTRKIPILDAKDHGGAVMVYCPDGSTRIFNRDEVQSIDPHTE